MGVWLARPSRVSAAGGQPYRTRLDPPPSDPQVVHQLKGGPD